MHRARTGHYMYKSNVTVTSPVMKMVFVFKVQTIEPRLPPVDHLLAALAAQYGPGPGPGPAHAEKQVQRYATSEEGEVENNH
mmetsp:Transcript_33511/g.62526  ORF Transcript_33511/g.62526 Transcript_33511/m.62526 type:complete len:82 (-) Transcript_33511:2575-2820(-)